MTLNLGSLLAAQAAERPDAIAIGFARSGGWDTITFADLHRLSDRYAAGFRAIGARRGDRALYLIKPSIDAYGVLFGLLKLGAVPVLIDPGMGLRNVLACIEQVRPRVVVALPAVHVVRLLFRRPFASAEILVTGGARWFWGGHALSDCLGPDAPFEIDPVDSPGEEAAIVFTSGSTGTPKGVSWTRQVFHGVTALAGPEIGRSPGGINLETFAAYVVIDVAQGITSVVPQMNLSKPATADPARLVEAIQDWQPNAAFGSPIVLRKITDHCAAKGITLPSLTDVLTGVAEVPGDLHGALRAIAPRATLHVNYGSTEAMTATHIATDEVIGETWPRTARGEGSCVGRPFPGVKVHIVPITDGPIAWRDDLPLPAGELGEVVIDGPIVSPEYKDRPDANALAKITVDGRVMHRMGDLGVLDEQGRLWYCGRVSHRLVTARGVVPCVPVEAVYNGHPAVRWSALVGVGEPHVPVLLVELRPGHAWSQALEAELHDLEHGTPWEGLVQRILPHPGFPTDARHNAKIRREVLAEWAGKRVDVRRQVEGKEGA